MSELEKYVRGIVATHDMHDAAEADPLECAAWMSMRLQAAEQRAERAEAEIAEMNKTFDLRWEADMEAIERWQKETGRELTWPDRADLCVWLLEQLDRAEAAGTALLAELEALRKWRDEAVAAMQGVVRLSGEAFSAWDADNDHRVGKIISAMAGRMRSYRPEATALHAAIAAAPGKQDQERGASPNN